MTNKEAAGILISQAIILERASGKSTLERIRIEAICKAVEALEKQATQEWISVDDRLPEEDGYYLCCIKSSLYPDRVYIDILECDKGSFEEGHIYTDTVTHWMLLPEPPKGE